MTESRLNKPSVGLLILWPAVITLAITVLRLEGELHHWSSLWFNRSAGGGGAVVGISWLPIFFGPYFALRLAATGEGPVSYGRAFGATFAALVVMIGGVFLVGLTDSNPGILTLAGFVLMLAAAFIPSIGWGRLGKTLLAYAFAARIPVLVIMYFAMKGNWGTHYDAVSARYQDLALWKKFFEMAFLPQMFMWITYTVVAGSLFGEIVAALFGRKLPRVQETPGT
jgi:hypothetical protein